MAGDFLCRNTFSKVVNLWKFRKFRSACRRIAGMLCCQSSCVVYVNIFSVTLRRAWASWSECFHSWKAMFVRARVLIVLCWFVAVSVKICSLSRPKIAAIHVRFFNLALSFPRRLSSPRLHFHELGICPYSIRKAQGGLYVSMFEPHKPRSRKWLPSLIKRASLLVLCLQNIHSNDLYQPKKKQKEYVLEGDHR